jgi:hypothetical protein
MPFDSEAGLDPVTKGCNISTPIKLSDLAQLHNIHFLNSNNPDVFFIDSEGYG